MTLKTRIREFGDNLRKRWTCATSICERICKAHVIDETFRVNSAFNAEVFVAAPHAVAMEVRSVLGGAE